MNSRRRNQFPGRGGPPQVQFCQRCGGVITSQGGMGSQNACRCTKEERERYRGGPATSEAETEAQQQTTDEPA